ncbi:MAG: regulatory protein [Abditibacteriota bacterium]|jgi:regulatory protein|nr:regulatory protein [Abditibacteriota bacterium]
MKQPFPGIITRIEEQARTRKHLGARVNVFIDDKFSFAIDADLAQKSALQAGVIISQSTLSHLLREDGATKAYRRALYFASFRARSEREIRERLKRDEWADEIIDDAIERLKAEKVLNDAQFAATWVEGRTLSRPRGSHVLRQELRVKGVAREEIEAALPSADEESENAVSALRARWRTWERFEGRERDQKMIEFLQRRGFNYSTARTALKRLEEEDSEP